MKKLLFAVLFSSLSIVASAGYSLSFGDGYPSDGNINLTPGEHTFILANDGPLIGGVSLVLALHPIAAAHFIIPDIQPFILPDAWTYYPIVDPDFPDYDLLFIQLSSPDLTPVPIGNLIEFGVDFTGPAADFEVWDEVGGPLLGPYHLVPEPVSLLLLGLGGLALRMRKK